MGKEPRAEVVLEGSRGKRGSFPFREGQSYGWPVVLLTYLCGCWCAGGWSSAVVREDSQCLSFLTLWPLHSALSPIGVSGSPPAGTGPGAAAAAPRRWEKSHVCGCCQAGEDAKLLWFSVPGLEREEDERWDLVRRRGAVRWPSSGYPLSGPSRPGQASVSAKSLNHS